MSTSNGWLQSTAGIPVRTVNLAGTRGNGPFASGGYYGWVLHVNVGNTPVDLFTAGTDRNPYSVTPTIQVYKSAADGGVVQFLPLNWQPWCQIDGNYHYGAAETAGYPTEPLTDFQLDALAYFHAESHKVMGAANAVATSPGQHGIGTHQMGGLSWGGHSCPGTIRENQRPEIIRRAEALLNPEADVTPEELKAELAKYDEHVRGIVENALAAVLTGSPHSHWNHLEHPDLVASNPDYGVLDRLKRLETEIHGLLAPKAAAGTHPDATPPVKG